METKLLASILFKGKDLDLSKLSWAKQIFKVMALESHAC